MKEDLERCKQSAQGLEHTAWTEVCETEVSRVKTVHNDVMNKTSQWMLTLVDYGITNNSMNVSSKKVNLEKNITQDQIRKMEEIIALVYK